MTTFSPPSRSNPQPIIVMVGNHFKDRFKERCGHHDNLIEYLNSCLNEGHVIKDMWTKKGIYFTCAGLYVPLSPTINSPNIYFAITIQHKYFKPTIDIKKIKKVKWIT